MEFEVLEKTKNSLTIKVIDDDPSVMYPMVEQLLSEKNVTDVNYSVEHPDIDDPILSITAKKGKDPRKILIDIARDIQGEFHNLYQDLFETED